MQSQNTDLLADRVADLIVGAKKTLVFTGAGISTESGIPDFRSPGGIWDRFDPSDFTYDRFVNDAEVRKKQWRLLGEGGLTSRAEPNLAHLAIGELDKLGRLDCVVTQNIDNLHQRGGVPNTKVFELHGNMQWAVCLDCGKLFPFEKVKIRLDGGEEEPECEICHGILKPNCVLFGESLPMEVLREASRRASACDLCIVIGSTLVVYPAAYIPGYAVKAGAKLVIINLSPTPLDHQADVLIRAKAGEVMSLVVRQVKAKMGIL